ncbi:aminomethyl-transferring glycine dehydrogenase subunit GcvPB [Paenibacillus macerans]|uniref:aminomethyl-transferring glycine dehydrogenase subunit GcvPB n=1 Tax=Paenibacillus macerans TaxID=44252 RepID=UPI003D26E55C
MREINETKPEELLIFERSRPGRIGYSLPECDVPAVPKEELVPPEMLRREGLTFPEVYEVDVVRHYTALSRRNFGVDNGFYPLGSCTMKYNPKINEDVARYPGFAKIHPYQPEESLQGALELMYRLQRDLAGITGMDEVTLQPAAGAHGEWTGLMMIRAYHESRGEKRTKVIVPDSSHGTNPASAAVAGFETVTVPSTQRGMVDLDALRAAVGEDTAALMLTNPNTLGLFEQQIVQIAEIVHAAGGLLYYDGANSNAIMGITRPGDMGFDVVHLNLHKTMSTPHGGGGPGAGPVGVKKRLAPFLPEPTVVLDESGRYAIRGRRAEGAAGFAPSVGTENPPSSVSSVGSVGSVGSPGSAGSAGSVGSIGSPGSLGSAGSIGSIGSPGSAGSVGSLGSPGSLGSAGSVGSDGPSVSPTSAAFVGSPSPAPEGSSPGTQGSASIGRVKAFYGNFGILVRAYAYIRSLGPEGLRQVSENAVLNANYMMKRLAPYYEMPYEDQTCKHEFVMSGSGLAQYGIRTLDVAKRLLDFGYHPPTIYFPLNVEECIMIEPTETESKETLDGFIDCMIAIAKEAETNPDILLNAPYTTPVTRLDETGAARKPVLNCSCG